MPQWRKDPIVDRWVVIATERAKRPSDFNIKKDEKKTGSCPLCPGNENETPPETLSYRKAGSNNNDAGWWVRVVPNKFPAVSAIGESRIKEEGPYKLMDGVGLHEVVIESCRHQEAMQDMDEKQIQEVLFAWRERLNNLKNDSRVKYIQIFKNYGLAAGASMEHSHSQIMGIPMLPAHFVEKSNGFKEFAGNSGRCILCHITEYELSRGERVIDQNAGFVCLAPFASRVPFEMMIVPRQHQQEFGNIGDKQIQDLASMLNISLKKMSLVVNDPPFNICLYTTPVNTGEDYNYFHWHLEILPKLNIAAGFELGTGFYINPTSPEYAARSLRETDMVYREVVNNV